VHHAVFVRVGDRLGHLGRDLDRLLEVGRLLARYSARFCPGISSIEIVPGAPVLPDVVDLHDGRVGQPRHRAGLVQKRDTKRSSSVTWLGSTLRATTRSISRSRGAEDRGHAARADLAEDLVAPEPLAGESSLTRRDPRRECSMRDSIMRRHLRGFEDPRQIRGKRSLEHAAPSMDGQREMRAAWRKGRFSPGNGVVP
jgi:hypothetical protein